MSQTRIKRRIAPMEVLEFSEDTWTDKGERVWKNLRLTFRPQFGPPLVRVIQCDKQLGITEEWIEDTLAGAFEALAKDYPDDDFKLIVTQPNDVIIQYCGPRGSRYINVN